MSINKIFQIRSKRKSLTLRTAVFYKEFPFKKNEIESINEKIINSLMTHLAKILLTSVLQFIIRKCWKNL